MHSSWQVTISIIRRLYNASDKENTRSDGTRFDSTNSWFVFHESIMSTALLFCRGLELCGCRLPPEKPKRLWVIKCSFRDKQGICTNVVQDSDLGQKSHRMHAGLRFCIEISIESRGWTEHFSARTSFQLLHNRITRLLPNWRLYDHCMLTSSHVTMVHNTERFPNRNRPRSTALLSSLTYTSADDFLVSVGLHRVPAGKGNMPRAPAERRRRRGVG